MDQAILWPSPNWFLVSGLAVTTDEWVIYGGPAKSLCVLEPLAPDCKILAGKNGYRSHIFAKVHSDKVTSVDVCPGWSETKNFISGAMDGTVKLWYIEKVDNTVNIKFVYNHSLHSSEQEDVVGVGYSTINYAITVGSHGRIVKWDLRSNIVKSYNLMLAKFKPTCISCSPHMCLHVAVGTKQGVVLVLNLNDKGTTLYKVRCHDDEILCVSWCPQFNVNTKKMLKTREQKQSANKRMERIRQEASKEENEQLDDSALSKTLPEDSFDEIVVEEEDLFDMYKDHEEDEFGHRKYTPEVIVVKEPKPKTTEFDYLAECQKLKDRILGKDEPETSINSLVDALDKTHMNDNDNDNTSSKSVPNPKKKETNVANKNDYNKQSQQHLLATMGKQGLIRVWSKAGKLLGNGMTQIKEHSSNKNHQKVNQQSWGCLLWYKPDVLLFTDGKGQLLQCNPLVFDCRYKIESRVVDVINKRVTCCMVSNAPRVQYGYDAECNQPENGNQIQNNESEDNKQCQNIEQDKQDDQLDNTAVVLPEDKWHVWTAAQDRSIVCYSMTKHKKISTANSCGGYVYNIQTCPYDAKKIAICVGDGAIRIWETGVAEDNDEKLILGNVTSYWQNVQGKVLVTAWHPTKENILAFGTAESRVGILDISRNSQEKPARVLNVGLTGGVYSVCWGERNDLYVCAGGDIVLCHLKKEGEMKPIQVQLDGDRWRLTAVSWFPSGLLCGSITGSIALLSNTTYEIQAVCFLFKKLINSIEWHPPYTSSSSEESTFKNLVAVSSMDKCYKIAILKHSVNEGKQVMEKYKYLEGHKGCIMQLAWSPHHEGQLASTSSDATVRVWDVSSGTVTTIFSVSCSVPISLAWSAFPQHSNVLITGGSDYSVRLWKMDDYPPEAYVENLPMQLLSKRERRRRTLADRTAEQEEVYDKAAEEAVVAELYGEGREADQMAIRLKAFKRFLLPICSRQISNCTSAAARKLAEKYILKIERSGDEDSSMDYDTDFIKMFGPTNDLNELLDTEMEHHLETRDTDAWIMLAIIRGQMDTMFQFTSENDLLCPFLVSLAPGVSFKYWKDVTQLYFAQINRFVAQKKEHRLLHARSYGGPTFRKAALLLCTHDVKGAVDCLVESRLYREAYVLCRVRHMESIARETLWLWLKDSLSNGYMKMVIMCYIALGEVHMATTTIAEVADEDETWLSLAADLAKGVGQHTFAGHLEDRKEQIKQAPKNQELEDTLQHLPTRIELLLKSSGVKHDMNEADGVNNDLIHKNGVENVQDANGVKHLKDENGVNGNENNETKE